MRIVELVPEVDPVEMARSASGLARSRGTHVTEVIRHLENTVLKKDKRKPYDELTKEERRRMGAYTAVGWAWEKMLRDSLAHVYSGAVPIISTGEISQDGITGTPDGLDPDDMTVEEYKATWRSSRRASDLENEFWSWMVQIKAYCHMLGMDEATLHTFFVNGDYRESGPQMRKWRLIFDRGELERNWNMLRKGAESLCRHRDTQT